MAGYLGTSRMLLFRNYDKTPGSNEPDYELFAAPDPNRGSDDDGDDRRDQSDDQAQPGGLAPQQDTGADKIDSPF
jgi:hypothetical protein